MPAWLSSETQPSIFPSRWDHKEKTSGSKMKRKKEKIIFDPSFLVSDLTLVKERLTVVSTCLGAFLRTSRCWRPNNVPTVNDDRDSLSCHSSGHQDRVLTCPKKRKRKENKSKNVRKSLITFHFCFFFFFFLILWTWSSILLFSRKWTKLKEK